MQSADLPGTGETPLEWLEPQIKGEQTIVVRSPGRINLISGHTNYNEDYVLPATIEKTFYLEFTPNANNSYL